MKNIAKYYSSYAAVTAITTTMVSRSHQGVKNEKGRRNKIKIHSDNEGGKLCMHASSSSSSSQYGGGNVKESQRKSVRRRKNKFYFSFLCNFYSMHYFLKSVLALFAMLQNGTRSDSSLS
jgi:hypothetical protein